MAQPCPLVFRTKKKKELDLHLTLLIKIIWALGACGSSTLDCYNVELKGQ